MSRGWQAEQGDVGGPAVEGEQADAGDEADARDEADAAESDDAEDAEDAPQGQPLMSQGTEELDEAIGKFVRETLEREGPVTGWVLCVSHMKYTDDEPSYGWDYSCGPQTDLVRAIGLLEVVRTDIDGTVSRAAAPDDDED